jgi:aconitate hydratase
MIVKPSKEIDNINIIRGPNIRSLPLQRPLKSIINGEVLIKVGDNVTTDAILPAGAKVLALRSNIPAISEYIFQPLDPHFVNRTKEKKGGFIVAGENYGQGSSREHAALAPMHLGIKGVLAKSFARIHKANLINFGVLPLEFTNPDDYNSVELGNRIRMNNILEVLSGNNRVVKVKIKSKNVSFALHLSRRMREILVAGGLLNYTKERIHPL